MRPIVRLAAISVLTLPLMAASQPLGAAQDSTWYDEPTTMVVLNDQEVQGILGRQVVGRDGADMGRIVDVIVDQNGQMRAAVIDFGGFLGVGSRKIAVDWNSLQFTPGNAKVTTNLTRDQIKAAPDYKQSKPVVVVGSLGSDLPLSSSDK